MLPSRPQKEGGSSPDHLLGRPRGPQCWRPQAQACLWSEIPQRVLSGPSTGGIQGSSAARRAGQGLLGSGG